MTSARTHGMPHGRRGSAVRRWAARSRTRDGLRTAGRAGFAARGVLYLLIGYLAVRIAVGHGGAQADRQGALHNVASEPFGTPMLWLLAAGFACMALWRAGAAVLDTAGDKKTSGRVGDAARAVFYGTVCWGTASYAAGSGGGAGSDKKSQDWTATALGLPAGRFLVAAAGLVLVGAGVTIAVRAVQRRFMRKLDAAAMGRRARQAVAAFGVGGNCARGVIYSAAGVFVLVAAVRFDPHRAKGMDATLRAFSRTPAGPWLLLAVALGLVLFGVFSLASARWRRM